MLKHLLAFLLLLLFSSNLFSQQINELLKPLNLIAGEEKTFLISDLFYSESYDRVVFHPDNSLEVFYEPETGMVSIKSLKNSDGYGILPFHYFDTEYHLLYKTEFRQTIFFSYKAWEPVEKVNLFGSFNGWNRQNLPMKDENGDGIYETSVSLEPGLYEYKFYIYPANGTGDAEEIIDSLNSEVVPNGFGGRNSVLNVKPKHTGKAYLHILDYSYNNTNTTFSFYYESEPETRQMPGEVIALLENEIISENTITITGWEIIIDIPSEKLKGTKTLRVAANENGRASNLQTIMLKDGKPIEKDNKGWYDAVIYSIMIDRFSDGDKTNSIPVEHPELHEVANYQGGDLQGIIDKLKEGYFTELGINTLWISPVVDNTPNAFKEYPPPHRYYTGYHGYWPVHPTRVEEHLGDIELLKEMISIAHSKGIKVLLDFVANHIHEEHSFWKEHRDWFGVLELPDGKLNLRLWDEQRLTTWFEPYMPSFDFEGSKEALEVMTDNAVWWLKETKADGFRHDAVKHIPNEFWRTLTRKIKEQLAIPNDKIYYQVGETFGSYELVSSYVNNGQLDAQFNFNLYDTAIPVFVDENLSFAALDQQMQKTFSVYGVNHLMGNVMDSHDKVRFMAYADGDVLLGENAKEIGWTNPPEVNHKSSYDKLKLYITYLVTIPGIPVIYYGDEFGMTGADDPDNRRMMRFDDELTDWEKETLEDVKKIIKLRRKYSALSYGDFQTLIADENIYAYLRSDMNERILVVLNKGANKQKVELTLPKIYNLSKAVNLMNNKGYGIDDGNLSLVVDGIGFWVLMVY
jgi:cyclomaltodextrinase